MRRQYRYLFCWSAPLIFLLSLFLCPLIGAVNLNPDIWFFEGYDESLLQIFTYFRLPRVLLALLAGAGLALSGIIFQSLFKNPLATPYTLGVSTGATLGVFIFQLFIQGGVFYQMGETFAAFLGGMVSLGLVASFSLLSRIKGVFSLLIAGIAVNFTFSSLIMVMQYFSDYSSSVYMIRWLLGGMDVVGFKGVLLLGILFSITLMGVLYFKEDLNLIAIQDEWAQAKGVNIKKTRWSLFLLASIITSGVVAQVGPIGFVGIAIPNVLRIFIGGNHGRLIWNSVFLGGSFLAWCDVVSRRLVPPFEIPIGVITALLGGPLLLLVISKVVFLPKAGEN